MPRVRPHSPTILRNPEALAAVQWKVGHESAYTPRLLIFKLCRPRNCLAALLLSFYRMAPRNPDRRIWTGKCRVSLRPAACSRRGALEAFVCIMPRVPGGFLVRQECDILVTAGGMPHGAQTIGRSICGVFPTPIPSERIFQKEFPGQWNLCYTFEFVWFDTVFASVFRLCSYDIHV